MANAKYGLYLQTQLAPSSAVDWGADNIKAMFVDAAQYTPNMNTDQFLSDVPSGARIATSANLASKTTALGVAKAANVTITFGASQPGVEYIVLYKDTGTAGTSKLILLIDTAGGLPFTPAPGGGDVQIIWDAVNGIFTL